MFTVCVMGHLKGVLLDTFAHGINKPWLNANSVFMNAQFHH